ncbi:DUF6460 domain-containing protein [Methylocystis parvus]|uniref:DUF6460 domain-containing protein n=1 Tax=Methylocystis parvus TaxID=134 RepID=A0A6B8LYD0_9HYPH|nr:DUF6460 domain-containing protein [Methylocystis parvus]QGM97387.1 hypothetical protein F7D14_07795 [Methylocystis parvus]WBJ98700.1 DUF6460 domain-containing protein [Methylocystis parvus OBBP]
MTDRGPFANWPHLDKKPPRAERELLLLPSETESNRDHFSMASKNALEDFLGGSPLSVAIRLLFISLVVGALLMWLDIKPMDIIHGVQAFIDRIYRLGFDAVRELASYVVAGAAIVIPAWFVLRLLNMGGRK